MEEGKGIEEVEVEAEDMVKGTMTTFLTALFQIVSRVHPVNPQLIETICLRI